jgi:hypothetical protein
VKSGVLFPIQRFKKATTEVPKGLGLFPCNGVGRFICAILVLFYRLVIRLFS